MNLSMGVNRNLYVGKNNQAKGIIISQFFIHWSLALTKFVGCLLNEKQMLLSSRLGEFNMLKSWVIVLVLFLFCIEIFFS